MNELMKKAIIFLSILAALTVTYWPAMTGYYVFHDDYFFLISHNQDAFTQAQFSFFRVAGRWFGIYLIMLDKLIIHSVSDANIVRFISILNLSAAAFIIFRCLQSRLRAVHAWLISVLIFTLPPYQVLVSWVFAGYQTFGILLSLCAAVFVWKSYLGENVPLGKKINLYNVLSFWFIFIALGIHQMSAMFYWAMAALFVFFKKDETPRELMRVFLRFFRLGVSVMVWYAIVLQILKPYYAGHTVGIYNPYVITTDVIGKGTWFIQEPLFNTLNFWNVFPDLRITIFSLVFLLLSLGLAVLRLKNNKEEMKKLGLWLGVMMVLLLLSYSPALLAVKTYALYRNNLAMMFIVVLLFLWAVNEWCQLWISKKNFLLSSFLVLTCLAGMLMAHRTVYYYVVLPNQKELEYVKRQLQSYDLNQINVIDMKIPGAECWNDKHARFDEFGVITSCFEDNAKWLIEAAMKELGIGDQFRRFHIVGHINNQVFIYPAAPDQGDKMVNINKNIPIDTAWLIKERPQRAKP